MGTNGCGQGKQTAPPVLTVDTATLGPVLPQDYLGLSFESSVLESPLLDPGHSDLPAFLRDLGVGRLRFGGNSLDRVTAWTPDPASPLPSWAHGRVTPEDLRRLGVLSAATGWRVDLGLTLGHPDATAAADETAAARRLIGAGLGTVEIGNEPDLFAGNPALKPAGYTYQQYRSDVDRYRTAITGAAPDVAFAGPDTAGLDWLASYGHDEHDGLAFLTQHFYPLTRCGSSHPTIADLESPATTRRQQQVADAAVATARGEGLGVRLDETNSASCGGQDGVSNTLASALWIVNYLLGAAKHGVSGVDVHGGLAACRGYTPLCVPGAKGPVAGSSPGIDPVADASLGAGPSETGRLAAQPDFYGLLFVHQLEGGRWLSLRLDRSTPLDAFAVQMRDGSVRVALINPDPHFTGTLTIHIAGHRGTASVLRLTGPSLGATAPIQFGGSQVAGDGTWEARPGDHLSTTAAGVPVDIGPASAVLVTLPPT
ncbi:MAG TPA: glycosyl hydrolase family 79 C-terminal domain-containing protein [Acidimicrobiales bacterium]|nr:glycosyl hydrolase family 79 C-terminal domain-containing protein [Acidimicrobiales bacterium]